VSQQSCVADSNSAISPQAGDRVFLHCLGRGQSIRDQVADTRTGRRTGAQRRHWAARSVRTARWCGSDLFTSGRSAALHFPPLRGHQGSSGRRPRKSAYLCNAVHCHGSPTRSACVRPPGSARAEPGIRQRELAHQLGIASVIDRVEDPRILSEECDRQVAADRTMPLPRNRSQFAARRTSASVEGMAKQGRALGALSSPALPRVSTGAAHAIGSVAKRQRGRRFQRSSRGSRYLALINARVGYPRGGA
jgi:hypothetical protein